MKFKTRRKKKPAQQNKSVTNGQSAAQTDRFTVFQSTQGLTRDVFGMAGDHETEHPDEAEGGPVKNLSRTPRRFPLVLIKSVVALLLGMLVSLVCRQRRRPHHQNGRLMHARIHYFGTNQIVAVGFGTNHLGNFFPHTRTATVAGSRHETVSWPLKSSRLSSAPNRVLGWRVNPDPNVAAEAQRAKIDLINLSPAGDSSCVFKLRCMAVWCWRRRSFLLSSRRLFFRRWKMHERKYVYHGLIIGVGLFLIGVCRFCYFILMPVALAASQMYSQWLGFGAFQWRAEDYISFVCKFMLGMGLGFRAAGGDFDAW